METSNVELRTSVYASNFRPIALKLWQNTFQTICKNRFFENKIGRKKNFDQKFLMFGNFRLILEELDGFGRQNQLP